VYLFVYSYIKYRTKHILLNCVIAVPPIRVCICNRIRG